MKDILIMWILIQLIVIGMASTVRNNEILTDEYICKREQRQPWVGAVVPLSMFVPESLIYKEYCIKQLKENL